jgi:hypothetical protein
MPRYSTRSRRSLLRRHQVGAQRCGEWSGRGDHDLLEWRDGAVGQHHLQLLAGGVTRCTRASSCTVTPAAASASATTCDHRGVPTADVAEHLLLQAAAAGGVEPLDGRPDECGRRPRVRVAQLGPQQRLPERVERCCAAPPAQPPLDRDALHLAAVADLRADDDGRAQAHLVDGRQARQPEELDRVRDGTQRAVGP